MLAARYDRHGPAREVLLDEEVPRPEPGPGEVRVRVRVSGVNPTDWKSRSGATGGAFDLPFQVPNQDGAGTIDAVGPGVDAGRVGQRVWLYFAARGRQWGTAAQWTVVPEEQAVPLPGAAPDDLGASLGIPAITAHRCLFADGPIDGRTVLVAGGAGAVGHAAIELARRAGARVVATVSSDEKARLAREAGAHAVVDYRAPDASERLRAAAPEGVARVVELALGANLELDLAACAPNAAISVYADDGGEARLAVRRLMVANIALRFVLVYTMPAAALAAAVEGEPGARGGCPHAPARAPLPARAHRRGARRRRAGRARQGPDRRALTATRWRGPRPVACPPHGWLESPAMGERTSYTPGTFCWTDLATTDPDGAKAFYTGLLGWQAEDMPAGPGATYTMLRLDGKYVAALYRQPMPGMPPFWASYVWVEDADAVAARARQLGGTLLAEPFDVLVAGRMAVVQDPQGAVFILWQPRAHRGAALVNVPGALCLNQLNTSDPEAAGRFYADLFGWAVQPQDTGGGPPYWGLFNEGALNGGMMELPPGGQAPPHWLVFFASDDLDGAATRIGELGGELVVTPMPVGDDGAILIARDPQGAYFALFAGRLDP